MTREEEIKQYLKERNIPMDSLEANSIIEGLNWADMHPKEGLVSIDKACEWLEQYQEDCNMYDAWSGDYVINSIKSIKLYSNSLISYTLR